MRASGACVAVCPPDASFWPYLGLLHTLFLDGRAGFTADTNIHFSHKSECLRVRKSEELDQTRSQCAGEVKQGALTDGRD